MERSYSLAVSGQCSRAGVSLVGSPPYWNKGGAGPPILAHAPHRGHSSLPFTGSFQVRRICTLPQYHIPLILSCHEKKWELRNEQYTLMSMYCEPLASSHFLHLRFIASNVPLLHFPLPVNAYLPPTTGCRLKVISPMTPRTQLGAPFCLLCHPVHVFQTTHNGHTGCVISA